MSYDEENWRGLGKSGRPTKPWRRTVVTFLAIVAFVLLIIFLWKGA